MATAARSRTLVLLGFVAAAMPGCAAHRAKPTLPPPAATVAAGEPSPAPEVTPIPLGQTASPTTVTARLEKVAEEGTLHPCRAPREGEKPPWIDRTRRWFYETLCVAAFGFDGLFGERRDIEAARTASGRIELSFLNSDYEGQRFKSRGNVRVELPNLDHKVHAFLGRDDQDEFIQDRVEGIAIRSQFINVETREGWLAGLDYGLPGNYKQKTDFRVGGKLGQEPEIFVQGRHRRNWVLDRRNLFRFRETLFWTNRDGFGSTTSLDYDHIVRRSLLLRWASIGTYSEETKGLEYRTSLLAYHDLPGHRAMGYEIFLRGWTEAETSIREYGGRAIYRQSLMGRDWLNGEVVLGYSWPKEKRDEERDGSLTFGFGVEMRFGPEFVR